MTSAATKYDTDKPRMSLLDPYVLSEVAKVLTFGAKKYEPHNWRKGFCYSRLTDAVMRHVNAFNDGEDFDPDSGLSHLAHAMCGLMFLLKNTQTHPELDDRYKVESEALVVPEKVAEINEMVESKDEVNYTCLLHNPMIPDVLRDTIESPLDYHCEAGDCVSKARYFRRYQPA